MDFFITFKFTILFENITVFFSVVTDILEVTSNEFYQNVGFKPLFIANKFSISFEINFVLPDMF